MPHPALSESDPHVFLLEVDSYILDAFFFLDCRSFSIEPLSKMHATQIYNGTELSCEKKICCQIVSSACLGEVYIHQFLFDLGRHIERFARPSVLKNNCENTKDKTRKSLRYK